MKLKVVPKCSIFHTEQDKTGIKVGKCLFKAFDISWNYPWCPQKCTLNQRIDDSLELSVRTVVCVHNVHLYNMCTFVSVCSCLCVQLSVCSVVCVSTKSTDYCCLSVQLYVCTVVCVYSYVCVQSSVVTVVCVYSCLCVLLSVCTFVCIYNCLCTVYICLCAQLAVWRCLCVQFSVCTVVYIIVIFIFTDYEICL